MDLGSALCGIGMIAAFGCGAGACSLLLEAVHRARTSSRALTREGRGGAERLLRAGVPGARACARALLRAEAIGGLVQEGVWTLEERGLATTREALLSCVLAACALVGLLAWLVSGSALGGLLSACALLACAAAWAGNARDRRREELRDAVPDALSAMGVCFRSGYSLLQTFRQVARETTGPLSRLFGRAAHRLEVGQSSAQALESLREGSAVSELAFVSVALDVQHQTGGSMQQVLDAASETVEDQIELARSLRVQTAQAQLSARVVSVMPFVLVAIFSLLSPGFLSPFFESAAGLALLGLALLMEAAGILLVQRMLKVEVS